MNYEYQYCTCNLRAVSHCPLKADLAGLSNYVVVTWSVLPKQNKVSSNTIPNKASAMYTNEGFPINTEQKALGLQRCIYLQ